MYACESACVHACVSAHVFERARVRARGCAHVGACVRVDVDGRVHIHAPRESLPVRARLAIHK